VIGTFENFCYIASYRNEQNLFIDIEQARIQEIFGAGDRHRKKGAFCLVKMNQSVATLQVF
jgi:hypothetical protein